MLQRLSENFEYSYVLDRAAQCTDPVEQLAYVSAFVVSSYASTALRVAKPFNPLLNETYECDRTDDLGWRSVAEQVCGNPFSQNIGQLDLNNETSLSHFRNFEQMCAIDSHSTPIYLFSLFCPIPNFCIVVSFRTFFFERLLIFGPTTVVPIRFGSGERIRSYLD